MSRPFDVALVLVPVLFAFAVFLTFDALGVGEPLWAYLVCFVAFDVAHVWGTAFIAHLDAGARRRHGARLWWPIPVAFIGGLCLHRVEPAWFWTAMAYVAIFHFIKQQYGFVALYKARAKERDALDFHLDKLAVYTGALGPVLLWHASPRGQFDWFQGEERFLFTLPSALGPWVQGVMVAVALAWGTRQIVQWRRGSTNPGKQLWVVAMWVTWAMGIRMAEHPLVSAAFLNVIHGLPFIALVWWRRRGQREDDGPRGLRWMSSWPAAWSFAVFFALLFVIGGAEEALWDGLVWRAYLTSASVPGPLPDGLWRSAAVAALATPQLVHYYLDAYLWRMGPQNPDLVALLATARPRGGVS